MAKEKHELQERLLQAHAFISCLQQRTGAPASTVQPSATQQRSLGAVLQTPAGAAADAATAETPHYGVTAAMAGSAAASVGRQPVLALPASAAFSTPASSALLMGQMPAAFHAQGVDAVLLQEPMSPILAAAAARSKTVGEQRSAAREELQDVQQEQLGLHAEISRAKSALADIAGQLRASIGASTGALSKPAHSGSSSGTAGDSSQKAGAGAVPGVTRSARQAASGGFADEGSSRNSRGAASSASHGSKVASAARSYGPGRLQELQKAAAAVKSASAARSGNSSSGSKGSSSSVASRAQAKPDFTFSQVPGSAAAVSAGVAAVAQSGSDRQWDQLSDSGSGSASNSPNKQAAGATAAFAAAVAQAAPAGPSTASGQAASASAGAGSTHGAGGSSVRTAACLSTHSAAASGSGKGSISLHQLIADAESVSLEYGMSPGGYAAGTAAAARDAAAAAAAANSMPALVTPSSAAASRILAGAHARGMAQQQSTEPFAFDASQMGRTPGSAASSAGAGGLKAQQQRRGWAGQQHQWEMTPASVAGAGLQIEDMQSCMRPAGAASAAAGAGQQQGTPAAATPAGLERVASNTMLDQLALAAAPASAQASQQREARALQFGTPTNLAGVYRDDAADAHAASSVQQPAGAADNTAHDASTAVAVVAGLTEQQSSEASAGYSAAKGAAVSAAGSCGQPLQQEVTPVKATAAGQTAAPVAEIASPPSALKKAAAALLASISPAGLVTAVTPEAASAPRASTAAGMFAAGLSPQLLQHLTPEWLRSLKRKCKQESEQLQQLRRQMGLTTPEGLLAAQQQASARMAPAASASAAGEGGEPSATPSAPVAVVSSDTLDLMPSGAGGAPVSSTATTPAVLQTSVELVPAASAAAVGCASSSSTGSRGPVAAGGHSAASLGQISSRISIDRLRRRAIMAQATAAAATPLGDAGAETAPAGDSASKGAPDLAAAAAAAGITGVPKALAWAAADAAAWDDQLDRTDSAGSLADYMKGAHAGHLREDVSAPVSRTGSITPGMLLARPECPTPGSMYSEVNDALSNADDALSGRDSPVSPDMLLAGLRSSRLAARQLQQQLMHQLEKTTSMPSTLSRQHEAALGSILGSGSLPRTDSASATMAAAAAAKVAAADAAASAPSVDDSSSCCGSPALEASTQLISVPQGQHQQQHRQLSRLVDEAGAAAGSPSTPGAALDAGAESRLLAPGAQLELVFDDQDEGSGHEEAVTGQQLLEQQQEQHVLLPEVSSAAAAPGSVAMSTGNRSVRQQQQNVRDASPAASDGSFCMLPFGVAAKAQPGADSALVAPSPPASVMTVTPGGFGLLMQPICPSTPPVHHVQL